MQTGKSNLIIEKTFEFSVQIMQYVELLMEQRKFPLANQLFKSGTSIGANVREAQNAESKVDFIHKMKIAAKEADETEYWLLLCESNKKCPPADALLKQIETINKILSKLFRQVKDDYQIIKLPNHQIRNTCLIKMELLNA